MSKVRNKFIKFGVPKVRNKFIKFGVPKVRDKFIKFGVPKMPKVYLYFTGDIPMDGYRQNVHSLYLFQKI